MALSMRDRDFGAYSSGMLPLGVKWLLIINTAVFVLYFFARGTAVEVLFLPFGLVPSMVVGSFAVWQLVTYLFLHSPFDIWHILLNMLAVWMFGAPLERVWGTRRFLRYYFVCGVGAGLCTVLANYLTGTPGVRIIGASGAVYGLLLAFAVVLPDAIIAFALIFPMKAKYYAMIVGAIVFLSTLSPNQSNVSHVSHLGGMVVGYVYLKRKAGRVNLTGELRRRYRDWKFQRSKRKFQVYLKKQNSRPDRWVQ
jgi:membrane associated rhomboid family serine protease